MPKFGVLLTNTGTPDEPTPKAVRAYLREFLSDQRIVKIPRIIWLPILYGLILPFRSKKSAELYQHIWTPEGSPLRVTMQKIQMALANKLSAPVELGMNYGSPSIASGLQKLNDQHVEKIIILPLFPQHSYTTTPDNASIRSYADHPAYIQALAASLKDRANPQHLLISFHGIPERYVRQGDPYQQECETTATRLAAALNLSNNQWTLCYQSQFGYDKWLKPSTFEVLTDLPKRGIYHIDIICPGFAVDCLETLEEINIRGREIFLQAGGQSLRYIPALNNSSAQINLLASLALSAI